MELRAWQQCQRNPQPCTGTVSLLPPSWDTISALYNQVLRVVSKFPGHRRLVFYLAYKGATVKVDLGDVKATGALCVLGLGIGLGTLFIYRLYHRYIRPFIEALQYPDPEDSICSDLSVLLDSSDSGVAGARSKNSDKQLPALLSCVQYGVALGGKGLPPHPYTTQTVVDGIRLRRTGTRRKPVRRTRTQRDSNRAGCNLSPALLEVNFRDSFYSTAESGFETLPEWNEDDVEEEVLRSQSPQEVSLSSGKGNVEQYRSSSSGDPTNSSPSGNKTVLDMMSARDDSNSDVAVTVLHKERLIHTTQSSPVRKADRNVRRVKKYSSYPHSLEYDDHLSLDASESIQSFNSSSGEEWSWEDSGDQGRICPLPPSSHSDRESHESLMQRVQEWTMSVEDAGCLWSPTPEMVSPVDLQHVRQVHRSRSLDRQLADPPLFLPDIVDLTSSQQVEKTIRNLECLETEFHDIQDEFASITSRLHDLIERGRGRVDMEDQPQSHCRPVRPCSFPVHLCPFPYRNSRGGGRGRSRSPLSRHVVGRTRTRWERMPRARSRSQSSSSRASSVEFSWDCGEVGDVGCAVEEVCGGGVRTEEKGVAGLLGHCCGAVDLSTEQGVVSYPGREERAVSCGEDQEVCCVGEAVPIAEYAEREWKGETHKAQTIMQGYAAIPDLLHCRRLRKVRGDHYCLLRSVLFQALAGGHQGSQEWPGPVSLSDKLHTLYSDETSGLHRWTFAGPSHLGGDHKDRLNRLTYCILTFYATVKNITSASSREEQESRAMQMLNKNPQQDCELLEGLKLMMLLTACHWHSALRAGGEEGGRVPTFVQALFARESSPDLVSFVQNRLNCVGLSVGIDQVELCLLAHTLGVRVHITRLHRYGFPDFDSHFPPTQVLPTCPPDLLTWPTVSLVTEDDERYFVPAP